MKIFLRILGLAIIGGFVGGTIRLIAYLIYRTPAIGFDGPAGFSFILAIFGGSILFAIVGFVFASKKKP